MNADILAEWFKYIVSAALTVMLAAISHLHVRINRFEDRSDGKRDKIWKELKEQRDLLNDFQQDILKGQVTKDDLREMEQRLNRHIDLATGRK